MSGCRICAYEARDRAAFMAAGDFDVCELHQAKQEASSEAFACAALRAEVSDLRARLELFRELFDAATAHATRMGMCEEYCDTNQDGTVNEDDYCEFDDCTYCSLAKATNKVRRQMADQRERGNVSDDEKWEYRTSNQRPDGPGWVMYEQYRRNNMDNVWRRPKYQEVEELVDYLITQAEGCGLVSLRGKQYRIRPNTHKATYADGLRDAVRILKAAGYDEPISCLSVVVEAIENEKLTY